MTAAAPTGAAGPWLRVRGRRYRVILPSWRDPRMHLAVVIWSLQILGQTVLDFRVSIAQILLTLVTCALLDMAFEFGRRSVIMWPASALLTANGIAFILRVPGTEHGDWWSLNGWWIYVGVSVFAILSKHLIRYRGRHIFNPSNVALVACFLVLGEARAEPLDFWWGPMLSWVALGLAIIVLNGLVILWRVGLLSVAMGFWVAFAAGLAVISVADHAMTARWHFGPITGWSFWSVLVTSPEVLLFMFFMITDPKTVPRGRVARVAFAVCVGLLGALLIAPQKTEFGAKVGLLSALTIACAARPLLEHLLPSPGAAGDRLGAALSHVVPRRALAGGALLVAPALYVVLLLLAGTPARLGGEALAASGPAPSSLPPVTVLHANDVASQIDRPLALRVAGDAMADLRATNEALRRRDPALAEPAAAGPWLAEVRRQIRQAAGGEEIAAAAHQVRRIQVGLARKPGQAAPAVLVTLAGTIRRSSYGTSDTRALRTSAASPWSQTFEMAAGDTRYRIVAQRSAADHAGSAAPRATSPIEVRLAPTGPDSVPQGGRFGFRVTLHNPTDTGAGSRVELSLAGPDGVTVPFAAEEKLVPGRGDATLTSAVVPATWFEQLGDYEIAARVDGRAAAERLRFTVTRPPVEVPRFDDVTDDAGVRTTVPAPACGTFSSGAAWGDADGDGNLDLFVTRLGKPARLYMGDGKGRFSEQAARRGADVRFATGAAFADYDGDGRADLFVARAGHASLLLRNTGGRFTDVTRRAGLAVDANASGGAWADVDGDGDLDLYVANYVTCIGSWDTGLDELSKVRYAAGRLLRNDGDGRFSDVTRRLHGKTRGAAFTAAWFDADGDGRPDLYLANDFVGQRPDSNRLWRNTGDGRLRDVSEASGTALFMNTMGIGVGDVDRDGRLDLALSNIGGNRLLRNAGRGRFTDVAGAFGVARPWQRTGRPSVTWGVGFADLNLDGWDDLLFAAGNISKRADGGLGPQPDQLFVGDGTGRRMLDLSAPSGVTDAGDTKGAAFADYDRDGRMDVFLVDQGGTGRLLHNVTPRGDTHWLEVDPRACGVRVVVHIDGQRPMTDEVACGGTSVGSGNQAVAHFGLGRATRVDRLEVRWGPQRTTVLHDVAVDRLMTVKSP